jgi:hypothetical protein
MRPETGRLNLQTHRCAGYREACNIARDRLEAVAVDHSAEPDAFRDDLLNIARTTLSSKILTQVRLQLPCDTCSSWRHRMVIQRRSVLASKCSRWLTWAWMAQR